MRVVAGTDMEARRRDAAEAGQARATRALQKAGMTSRDWHRASLGVDGLHGETTWATASEDCSHHVEVALVRGRERDAFEVRHVMGQPEKAPVRIEVGAPGYLDRLEEAVSVTARAHVADHAARVANVAACGPLVDRLVVRVERAVWRMGLEGWPEEGDKANSSSGRYGSMLVTERGFGSILLTVDYVVERNGASFTVRDNVARSEVPSSRFDLGPGTSGDALVAFVEEAVARRAPKDEAERAALRPVAESVLDELLAHSREDEAFRAALMETSRNAVSAGVTSSDGASRTRAVGRLVHHVLAAGMSAADGDVATAMRRHAADEICREPWMAATLPAGFAEGDPPTEGGPRR